MKKLFISILIGLFLCAGLVVAQPVEPVEEVDEVESLTDLNLPDIIAGIPDLKAGVIYSLSDKEFEYASTAQLLVWKDLAIEIGYATDDKVIIVVSYPILKLKDLGVNVPILDLIEFNINRKINIYK